MLSIAAVVPSFFNYDNIVAAWGPAGHAAKTAYLSGLYSCVYYSKTPLPQWLRPFRANSNLQ